MSGKPRTDNAVALVTGASSGMCETTAIELSAPRRRLGPRRATRQALRGVARRIGGDVPVIEADFAATATAAPTWD